MLDDYAEELRAKLRLEDTSHYIQEEKEQTEKGEAESE
jgi:hypothetical protein